MTTAVAPQLESDQESEPQSHRDLHLAHATRQEPDTHSIDATQGEQFGSRPYDDATQGVQFGSRPYDDATQGVQIGPYAYADATQGREIGSYAYRDATQGRQFGSRPHDDATQAPGHGVDNDLLAFIDIDSRERPSGTSAAAA
jgi:hypothetical protein